jgi:hypothetical protein
LHRLGIVLIKSPPRLEEDADAIVLLSLVKRGHKAMGIVLIKSPPRFAVGAVVSEGFEGAMHEERIRFEGRLVSRCGNCVRCRSVLVVFSRDAER